MSDLVDVVLPLNLQGPLTYRLPERLKGARPGCRVRVPLGSRNPIGCLLRNTSETPHQALKEVHEILDCEPCLSPDQLRLLTWCAEYYLTPIGEVLRHMIPQALLSGRRPSPRPPKSPVPMPEFYRSEIPLLTPVQQEVLARLETHLKEAKACLLHGITGSGKTEIYIHLARKTVSNGGQVLVLVPEIGLTPQIVARLSGGVGIAATPCHSGLTDAERTRVWEEARAGKTPLVVGTRSAIFLPFRSLRLLIVDEEHDTSFKQEERFCYNARDLALWKNRNERVPLVLGSATPSLEVLHGVRKERIELLTITERPAGAALPQIIIIDRRRSESRSFLSPELKEALAQNLKRREQSLLFLNRRGFSPFLLCGRCGFIPKCEGCDISLTYHATSRSQEARLLCHYCDAGRPHTPTCPRCNGGLTPFGVGTQRIERELKELFPLAQVARMDRDAARRGEWEKTLTSFRKREIDILVGTQMVTKGHDFPALTLVGIVDADVALNLPDFRAAERSFQILTQVSGRAGRADRPGRVFLQTFHPDNPTLLAAARNDSESFYERELRQRREAQYPPFVRLIQIRVSGKKREQVVGSIRQIAKTLLKGIPPAEGRILGPAPCPIERIRGRTRWHLLVKTGAYPKIQPKIRALLGSPGKRTLPSGLRMLINVDPMEMM